MVKFNGEEWLMMTGIYTRESILKGGSTVESKIVRFDRLLAEPVGKVIVSEKSIATEGEDTPSVVRYFEEAMNTKFEMGGNCFYTKLDLKIDGTMQQYFVTIDKSQKVDMPIKIIPLVPSGKELFRYKDKADIFRCSLFRIENDNDNPGEVYLCTKRMSRIVNKHRQGEEITLEDVKDYVQEIADWTADMKSQREKALERANRDKEKSNLRQFEYANGVCRRCKQIVISDRAYAAIVAEALSREPLETGGILLGHYKNGIWYVVESTDPGMKTMHTTVHHEMDDKYHNQLYPVISRLYEEDLALLGLWHRHPGSLNTFSMDDNNTNTEYAKAVGNGAISFLLNFVPGAELTCYYLDQNGTKAYYKPKVFIGDKYFEGTNFLDIASEKTLLARKNQMKRELYESAAI